MYSNNMAQLQSIAMPRKMSRLQNCDKEIKNEQIIHVACVQDNAL